LNLETVMIQVAAGLLVPLVAGLWPVLRGVAISVHTAISQYGLGGGRYGTGRIDRLLGRVQRLPRMMTLAVRNTFRRSGRVALTLLVLITAGAIFIMVLSAQNSFSTMVDDAWRSLGFDAFIVFDQPERIDEVIPLIESQPNVAYVEMWLWTDAIARIPGSDTIGDEEQIWIRAIPTDSQLYTPDLTDGRDLSDLDEHAILLNQKIAGDLGVEVGDQIELDFGARGDSTWTVVGLIFDITDMQSTAYAHIDTVGQELNLVGRAYVAEVQLSENGFENEASFVENIEVFLEGHGIDVTYARTASQDRTEAESQFQIVTTVLMVMTILMAVVGSIGLSGTLSINVIERRREIGVMRAVGASSMDVAIIFIYEGLLLGLLSWVLATPVGFLLGHPFVQAIGAVFEVPMEHEFAFIGVWIWLVIVLVLSLVASWLPARRATRISVNESLAYE
jgi:putative ABC transport system permease protein